MSSHWFCIFIFFAANCNAMQNGRDYPRLNTAVQTIGLDDTTKNIFLDRSSLMALIIEASKQASQEDSSFKELKDRIRHGEINLLQQTERYLIEITSKDLEHRIFPYVYWDMHWNGMLPETQIPGLAITCCTPVVIGKETALLTKYKYEDLAFIRLFNPTSKQGAEKNLVSLSEEIRALVDEVRISISEN